MKIKRKNLERLTLCLLISICVIALLTLLVVFLVYGDQYSESIGYFQSIRAQNVTQDAILNMIQAIGYYDIIIRSMFRVIGFLSILHLTGLFLIVIWRIKAEKKLKNGDFGK